ncbi:hypothetical protein DVH24_037766 [Malus domestica]|uniref:Uncharacterized protein n=1 Tax=Malus domestica TaxID=3750 RepID=A0A498JZ05_MALDO|nr:hypothetical protein DVH24_037766 [Malus domestica]
MNLKSVSQIFRIELRSDMFYISTDRHDTLMCCARELLGELQVLQREIAELWWPRAIQRCSDRIHKSMTHPRVFHLSNCIFKAFELCKWLRHSHVTASMPSFGTGCVIHYHEVRVVGPMICDTWVCSSWWTVLT